MVFSTDYKLEKFILETKWEDLPAEVQSRMKGCFVDLMGCDMCREKQYPHYNAILHYAIGVK